MSSTGVSGRIPSSSAHRNMNGDDQLVVDHDADLGLLARLVAAGAGLADEERGQHGDRAERQRPQSDVHGARE